MVREQVIICEMLSKINFFASLKTAELSQVAERMAPRRFKAGDVLIRQGDIGDQFFLLREGEVDVLIRDGGSEKAVAILGAGKYFGERALITGEVRNATVIGKGDGKAYALDKANFDSALAATPSLQEQLRTAYFARQ
jgi:putative ABC transport system ATP-binding protein